MPVFLCKEPLVTSYSKSCTSRGECVSILCQFVWPLRKNRHISPFLLFSILRAHSGWFPSCSSLRKQTANDTSEASPEARQALGHLLGHALNLGDSTTPNATAANGNAPGDSVLQGRAPAWTAQSRDTGDRLPSHKMGGDMESMSTANNSPQTPQSAQQVGIATIGVGA